MLLGPCGIAGSARPAVNVFIIILEYFLTAFWTLHGIASSYLAPLSSHASFIFQHFHLPLPHRRVIVNRRKELTAFTPEMIISSYGLATAEAQELTTVAALYFVAPFSSADGHLAFWT